MTDTLSPVTVAHDPVQVGALLSKLDDITKLLHEAVGGEERVSDSDQLYVVGGAASAAAVLAIQYPRTWRYVEITLSACPPATSEIALFDGNILLTDASNRHQHTVGQVMQSDALAVVASGQVKFRAYLNQTGYFTVYFTGAYTGYVNVRVRVLDKTQQRAVRT